MVDFYDEMAQMAREMLAPTSEDGLGQGSLVLARYLSATPEPNAWSAPMPPIRRLYPLNGAVRGVGKELVDTPIENGGKIVATDLIAIVAPPEDGFNANEYKPTDVIEVDGVAVTVLSVKNIPAAGTVCAIQFVLRR